MDPSKREFWSKQAEINVLIRAASNGDVKGLEIMAHCGSNLHIADYDDRTALHLTACEGHFAAVKFLIE